MNYHRLFDGMTIDGQEIDYSQLKETGKVLVGGEEWNASDLISEQDKLDIFNEDMLRTKEDILSEINSLLMKIDKQKAEDTKHSQAYYRRYIDLIERFKGKIEKSIFPKSLEDWWYYEYEVRETGVMLTLSHASMVALNEEGFIDSVFVDTTFDLFHVSAEMMTVEKYAEINEVTPTTVRQWIRRGKIRTAVKQGGEWRIPALAEVRERGYQLAQYKWDEFLTGFPEEYAFINDFDRISIKQDDDQKDRFSVEFSNKDETKKLQLDQKEKEKFELLLISNPFVYPVDAIIAC